MILCAAPMSEVRYIMNSRRKQSFGANVHEIIITIILSIVSVGVMPMESYCVNT